MVYVCLNMYSHVFFICIRERERETFSTMIHDPGVAGLKHFVGSPLHDLTWRSTIHIWLVCFFFQISMVQLQTLKKTSSKTTRPVARIICLSFHSSHCGNTRGARVTFSRCWQQTLPASWCGIPGGRGFSGTFVCQEKPKPPAFLSLLSMEKGNISQLT